MVLQFDLVVKALEQAPKINIINRWLQAVNNIKGDSYDRGGLVGEAVAAASNVGRRITHNTMI